VNRARLLRKKATDPERVLWRHLRNRNFAGYKFRRQHPLDCYILDFYCPTAKLAIDLDGGGHNYRGGQIRLQSSIQASIDKWRDSSLIQQRNSDEPNCNDTAGLSDLQQTEIA
jgi:very-short-patch-repair endonuclease